MKIVYYPNSILRKKTEEVKEISPDIVNLMQEMRKTMSVSQGVGLAAPQIGQSKRIIVVQTEKGLQAFINPKIIKKTKETELGQEGCLSFPNLFLKIKRVNGVEIKSLNEKGEEISFKVDGFVARIFQHEIDHLDGVLFIDRIGFWQRLKRIFAKDKSLIF